MRHLRALRRSSFALSSSDPPPNSASPIHSRQHSSSSCSSSLSCSSSAYSSSSSSETAVVAAASRCRHSCEGMSPEETRQLWQCMLDLQQRYGCYNSTRMDLAASAGPQDGIRLMPNRFIIDTLNHSVVHLPDEGWLMLHRHLRSSPPPTPCRRPQGPDDHGPRLPKDPC